MLGNRLESLLSWSGVGQVGDTKAGLGEHRSMDVSGGGPGDTTQRTLVQ